jgi:TRAP-type C4-dicarboxylate transport system permease small subunit
LPAEQVTSLQQTILDGTDYYTGSFFWNEGGPYTELYAWQFIASACALLSNLLDTAEYHNASSNLDPARLQNWVDNLEKAHFPASLVAIAGCVAGRLWAISGDRSQAAITFAHAIQIAQVIPPPGFPDAYDSQAWSDWSGPPDLLTRLQLEAASFLPGSLSSEQQSILIDWRKGILENGLVVTGRPEVEIERERLLSILLQAGLERQPPDLSEIEEIHKILNYNHQRQPTCFSHLRIPPLALTLGRAYLALGISSQAIELFLEHKNAALSAGGDDPTVRAMQIGMSEAVRRFRLFSQWPILCEDAIDPPYTTVWREAWVAGILSGNLRPENWQGPSDFWLRHFWDWNQRLGRSNSQQDAISQVTLSPSWRLESMSYSDVLVWLDAVAGSPTKPDQAFDPVAWLKNHPQKPENALHLALLANGTHTLAKSRDEGDVGVLRLPRSIVEAVPPRLRADITSQEAELLALQNPMEAAALFDQAIDWYKEALDPCGAWLAALGMSLCTTHLTRRAEEINAKSLNQLLKDYYLAFASQAPYSLPDWERLADFANLSESDGDKLLTNPTWGDWWVRLLVILSNQKQEAWIDAPKNQILHQRLLGRYGNNLPIELSFAPIQVDVVTADNIVGDETIAHVEAIPAPGSGCANSLARLLRSSAQLLGLGLIVIAVIAGILALLYLGFNYVISKLGLPSSIGFWPRLAMLLSTLGIGGLLVYLRALPRKLYDVTLGAWVASKSRLSWLIQRSSDKSEGSLLHLNADIAAWSWKPPFYKLVPSQWDWSQFASQAPQKTIDDKLPDEARQVLLSLKSRLRNRSVPLPLTAESYELLSPNWEKYLSFAIDSANLITTLDHLQVYRSLSSTKPRSLASAQTAWRQGMVRIVCSPSTNRIIENSWPKRAGHLVSTPDLPNEKDFQYKILHLVGMPLMTSSGLVWQVSSLTQEEEIYQTKSFDTAGRAGALLSVDQLPLESIAVIVLQLEPTFDPSPFTNIYDEQMRLARQFAARLLSVGAVQALVIPALPSILVPQVINALAKILLVSQLPQLAHMLSALQSVRKAIASGAAFPEKNRSDSIDTSSQAVSDYQQSSEERRALLALETCLFCAGEQRIAA